MRRVLAKDLPTRVGDTVQVCGWAHEVGAGDGGPRVVLRDHTGVVELVSGAASAADGVAAELAAVARESALSATGTVVVNDTAPAGPLGRAGLVVQHVAVVGPALGDPPVDEASPLEERLDWRFLDLRLPRNRLIFEVQTTAERAMREFWHQHGFLEIHSPKIRPIPNKSGYELFSMEYFERRAYLAQSPQFYKQMAMAAGFDRVFEIGPVFRANPLITSRHDTEFTSVDVEMSWIESHEEVMAFEEEWLCHVLTVVGEEHGSEISRVFGSEVNVPSLPFPRVSLAEARRIVEATGHVISAREGDIDAEGERLLSEHVARRFGHEFVFVTDYAVPARPYYHMRHHDRPDLTKSFDLLWKGVEVTTGAQREHRYPQLVAQAEEIQVPVEAVKYYLDFFKYGCPPHGGFGLGLTRLLMKLLDRDNVREVTYLYRGRDRVSP